MIFVLDASAMIAYLRDEPGAGIVAEALLDPESQCHAQALNLCEVFYEFHWAAGHQEALQAISDLAKVGVVENANLTPVVWQAAGALKRTSVVSPWLFHGGSSRIRCSCRAA